MTSPEDKEREEELEEEEYVKADRRASREAKDDERDDEEEADEVTGEEESAEAEATEEAAAEEAMEDEPDESAGEEAPPEGERPDINVYSLLRMSIGMYAEQAWIHMGVRMDPNKQKTETNLPLAQIAIDTVTFVAEKLQPDLDANEKREIEQLLANLRINYVQRS